MKILLKNEGIKVSIITIIINILLFLFKFIAGLIGHSSAMVSDAIHSLADTLTTIIVIYGLILANKKADKEHPYGHERIESVFGIILAFILILTGISIGYSGIKSIIYLKNLKVPTILPLIAACISIIVKEGMFQYTIKIAKKLNSTSLKADAYHHRSDAYSSIGSFIGILGSRLGLTILDPLCSIIICVLIIKTSVEIFLSAISQMLDTSCDEEMSNKIKNVIVNIDNNFKVTDFKTRMFGSKIYIDLEIAIDGDKTLKEANAISDNIHDIIEKEFKIVKHCNIHIIPESN